MDMNTRIQAARSSHPVFRIWMCGPFSVERGDGIAVPVKKWGGSKDARRLLKYLLSRQDRSARRGELLAALWPERDPEEVGSCLNDAAYQLRVVLKLAEDTESVLVSLDKGSRFRLVGQEAVWVDSDEALTLLKEAERLGPSCTDALPLLQSAVSTLGRGTFLEDEEGQWADGRRATLDRSRYRARLWLAESYAQRQIYGEAESLLYALLEEDPTDEDVLSRLMILLHRRGMTHQAMRLYAQTRTLFAQEGLEITEAVELLVMRLRKEEHQYLEGVRGEEGYVSFSPPHQQGEPGAPSTPGKALRNGTPILLPAAIAQPIQLKETEMLDCMARFGIKLAEVVTLVHQWHGMARFCNELQNQLGQEIKKLDALKSLYPLQEYMSSRRTFLISLAALPTALLASARQGQRLSLVVEELLPQCAASTLACWHLSEGSNLEVIEPLLDSYLPALISVTKYAPSYRGVSAALVAQIYSLKAILAWHLEGLGKAEAYCIQALNYSNLADNTNLRLTALNQHALILYYRKSFKLALEKSEEAEAIFLGATKERIFPIVRGRVCMYLAVILAQQNGKETEQTLACAHEAFASQEDSPEPVPFYADCGTAPLHLWDGLTHYHLGQRIGQQRALHSLRASVSLQLFGQLQPSTAIPERFRLECLNARTLVSVQRGEMEEAIACIESGKEGAKLLESKQRSEEVGFARGEMLRRWPKEGHLKAL